MSNYGNREALKIFVDEHEHGLLCCPSAAEPLLHLHSSGLLSLLLFPFLSVSYIKFSVCMKQLTSFPHGLSGRPNCSPVYNNENNVAVRPIRASTETPPFPIFQPPQLQDSPSEVRFLFEIYSSSFRHLFDLFSFSIGHS